MCSWPAGPGAIARGYHNISPPGLLNPGLTACRWSFSGGTKPGLNWAGLF